jgi:exodeoxyribonuclease VIII
MSVPKNIKSSYEEVLPGIYALVPNDVYHASDGLSSSNIKDIHKSIAHYRMAQASPKKQTESMRVGSALHDMVLLPDFYREHYMVASVKGKDTNKYKQTVIDNPDKCVLSIKESDLVHNMRDSLYKNPTISNILDNKSILREVSIWSTDPDTNVNIKCRPDLICNGIIFDLKTTVDPSPRGFIQSIYRFKYFVSDPFYRHVCSTIGMSISDFQFICVGNQVPYLTAIYNLNSDLLGEGVNIYKQSLLRYSEYMLSDDKWDGLANGREVVTL